MFSRFKTSLFQPAGIVNYQHDSKLITTLYFFFLALLATIPAIILIFSSNSSLGFSDKIYIKNELKGIEIPYKIDDFQLVKTNNDDNAVFEITLSDTVVLLFTTSTSIDVDPFYMGSTIIFTTEKIYYRTQFLDFFNVKYNEYEDLRTLNFTGATNNDSKFWDIVFPIVNDLIKEYSPRTKILNSIIIFLSSGFFLMLFSLLVAFFQRLRLATVFKLNRVWQLIIYTMTPYIVLTLIGDLYKFEFLSFIGVFISYIYANRMSMTIINK